MANFQITITTEAESHFGSLSVCEQRLLRAAIQSRLLDQPTTPTKAVKVLRPNPFAQVELRVGSLRVLYNVEHSEVVILAVGRKVGNKLVVKAEEFDAHQEDPTKSPRSRSEGDAN